MFRGPETNKKIYFFILTPMNDSWYDSSNKSLWVQKGRGITPSITCGYYLSNLYSISESIPQVIFINLSYGL